MGTGLYVNVTDGNSHLSLGHKRGKKVRLSKQYLKIWEAYIIGETPKKKHLGLVP